MKRVTMKGRKRQKRVVVWFLMIIVKFFSFLLFGFSVSLPTSASFENSILPCCEAFQVPSPQSMTRIRQRRFPPGFSFTAKDDPRRQGRRPSHLPTIPSSLPVRSTKDIGTTCYLSLSSPEEEESAAIKTTFSEDEKEEESLVDEKILTSVRSPTESDSDDSAPRREEEEPEDSRQSSSELSDLTRGKDTDTDIETNDDNFILEGPSLPPWDDNSLISASSSRSPNNHSSNRQERNRRPRTVILPETALLDLGLKAEDNQDAAVRVREDSNEPSTTTANASFSLPYSSSYQFVRQDDHNLPTKEPGQDAQGEEFGFTIRLMQAADILPVVEMCWEEYGSYGTTSATTTTSSSRRSIAQIINVWQDALFLIPTVSLALLAKLGFNQVSKIAAPFSLTLNKQQQTARPQKEEHIPLDNLVLVLTTTTTTTSTTSSSSKGSTLQQEEDIIGWVDLTQQVINPQHNPSIFPRPLWTKKVASKQQGQEQSPQQQQQQLGAWITNLLVAPSYRGQGWSKVLVAACEQTARRYWNHEGEYHEAVASTSTSSRITTTTTTTTSDLMQESNLCNTGGNVESIHLHCHAASSADPIPQNLYLSMGYRPGMLSSTSTSTPTKNLGASDWNKNEPFGSSSSNMYGSSAIYMIQGVPLLFMSKSLS